MRSTEIIEVPSIMIEQPIGEFYVGVMESHDLVHISWTDIRRIAHEENGTGSPDPIREIPGASEPVELEDQLVPMEDQDFEKFLGIQRELSPTRVSEIAQYVQTYDATFPTAVLLSISSEHAEFIAEDSRLRIVRHPKVAKVIDGQHRIAGLERYDGPTFQINVVVFIDMAIQDQAMVFSTINLKQTKVQKSLHYDLYAFAENRSPQRSSHDIVRLLNYKQGSPLYRRIKMLGRGIDPTETITQATFIDRLMPMISRDPMRDRDRIRRRTRLESATGSAARRQIFREFFIKEEDHKIAIILWNFFLAVQHKWPEAWTRIETGNVLNRTTGFAALARFLRVTYLSFESPGRTLILRDFEPIFERIDLDDMSFDPETYLPGSSGEKTLFDRLVDLSELASYR